MKQIPWTFTFPFDDGTSKSVTGYTPLPEKGVDYNTPADQESIVQQVIAALGTPVFGRVEEGNNIILTANGLPDGTYKLWYEDEEGAHSELCELRKSSVETSGEIPLNLQLGKIDTSNGSISSSDNYTYSDLIPIESGKTYTVTCINCTVSVKACYYDVSGNFMSASAENIGVVGSSGVLGSDSIVIPIIDGAAYFRMRFYNAWYGDGYEDAVAINIAGTKLTWKLA